MAYIITIAAYYILGLPLACLFSLKLDWGVIGLEAGFGVAIIALLICYGLLLGRTNWQDVADKAQVRLNNTKITQ